MGGRAATIGGNGSGPPDSARCIVVASIWCLLPNVAEECLPHDRTPLPVQAGEDMAGVHPAPAATTALFGPNFLANLVRQPLAVYLLVAINYVPQPRQGRPPLEQHHPQQTVLVTTLLVQDEAIATPAIVVDEK
jgi:hypothetical protein